MTKMKTHHEINFSPFATNVLDWVDKSGLQTPDGQPVHITRNGMAFVIWFKGDKRETYDNLEASYILNSNEVGVAS